MKNVRLLFCLFLFFGLLAAFLTFPKVSAATGPVGLGQLMSESGPGTGQVTLHWARYYSTVDNYGIWYGTKSGNYQYAVPNAGNVTVYTIGALQPGVRYYFFIQPYSLGSKLPAVNPEISDVAAATTHAVIHTAGPYGPRLLTAVSGPGTGEVTLAWKTLSTTSNNFHLVYGTAPGNYQYGALNVAPNTYQGAANSYTVGSLVPGQRYYFAVVPVKSGEGLNSSAEVSQVAHR